MYKLADLPGHPADGQTTLRQLSAGVRMHLGARNFVKDDENGVLMFAIGRRRKAIVKLRPDDTYGVEIGRMGTGARAFEWISERVIERGVYADALGEILIRLHAEVSGGE